MVKKLRIVIGADELGQALKESLKRELAVESIEDINETLSKDKAYPSIAVAAAELVAKGKADRAILICKTGIGMAIAANKVEGIRAAVAHDSLSIERSVLSNNAQVLAFGQGIIGKELALRLAKEWLSYRFDQSSPSAKKVEEILSYEARESEKK